MGNNRIFIINQPRFNIQNCYFSILDAEQLNKCILHKLKNNISKPTDKFPLRGARKSCSGSMFDTTLGIDDEHIGNNRLIIINVMF